MQSKTDIWMPLYIGDYLADTSHLDAERHGCYLLWMMHYWRRGPLPNNLADLVTIGKLRGPDASSIAQALLTEFFTLNEDGCWHQKRQDQERERWQEKRDNAIERAKKGAAGRWNNASSIPQAMLNPMLNECPLPSPLPLPLSSPLPPKSNGGGILPEMLAKELPKTLGLAAGAGPRSLYDSLYQVACIERDAGRSLEDLAVEMEAAYRYFEQEKPNLRIQWGPAAFFGDGHWRNPNGWPRKAKDKVSEREAARLAFLNAPTEDGS